LAGGRPDWKSVEFEMAELAELRRDVDFLKVLFNQRASTYHYLEEVFRIRNRWVKRTTFKEFKKLSAEVHGKLFDRRVTESRLRIVIELTCAGKAGKKATYTAAIYKAYKAGCSPSELSDYFKKKGGIAKAAYG
jgi:hypothetical protein